MTGSYVISHQRPPRIKLISLHVTDCSPSRSMLLLEHDVFFLIRTCFFLPMLRAVEPCCLNEYLHCAWTQCTVCGKCCWQTFTSAPVARCWAICQGSQACCRVPLAWPGTRGAFQTWCLHPVFVARCLRALHLGWALCAEATASCICSRVNTARDGGAVRRGNTAGLW